MQINVKNKTFEQLLSFCLFFMALWFFGNLYEEIVLTPNHVKDAYTKLKNWSNFFTVTNQIYYYVPFTHLSVIILWVLWAKSTNETEKRYLKKASIFGTLGSVLTVVIVTQLNLKLFFGNLDQYRDQLSTLSVVWLVGNAIRLYLVGSSVYYILKAFIRRKAQMVSQ